MQAIEKTNSVIGVLPRLNFQSSIPNNTAFYGIFHNFFMGLI